MSRRRGGERRKGDEEEQFVKSRSFFSMKGEKRRERSATRFIRDVIDLVSAPPGIPGMRSPGAWKARVRQLVIVESVPPALNGIHAMGRIKRDGGKLRYTSRLLTF